jgi:hypothetical protein
MIIHQPANSIHQRATGERDIQTLLLQMVLLLALCIASMATVALVVLPLH